MDMQSRGKLSRTQGFTLIEISIVLVVIGLLLSGGLVALAPVLENAKRTETENTITKIEDALTLYAIQYGCLPCPANGALAAGAVGVGQSQSDLAGGTPYTSQCVDENGAGTTCQPFGANNASVVPWVTLGLQEADAVDGWGNRINYTLTVAAPVFDNPVCTTPPAATPYTTGAYRCGVNFPTTPANFIQVNDTAGAEITNAAQRAVYVLVSQGPDGDNARATEIGTQRANAKNTGTQNENTDNDNIFVQGAPIDLVGTYFDDIVRWKTAPIFIQGCGESACGNAPYVTSP